MTMQPVAAGPAHTIAWQASADQATLAAIAAVGDQILTPSGANRFFVPGDINHLRWGLAGGISLTRAQLVAPSLLERRANLELLPRKRGTNELLTLGSPEIWLPLQPVPLTAGETIEAQTAEDGVAATQQTVIATLGLPQLPPVPQGRVIVARATGTTTLAARAWTSVTVTLDSNLPVGTYAVVGFVPFSANCLAARMNLRGQNYRPGMPGLSGASEGAGFDYDDALFRQCAGYDMGHFRDFEVPQFDFFAIAGDTAETVILYLVKVS